MREEAHDRSTDKEKQKRQGKAKRAKGIRIASQLTRAPIENEIALADQTLSRYTEQR